LEKELSFTKLNQIMADLAFVYQKEKTFR